MKIYPLIPSPVYANEYYPVCVHVHGRGNFTVGFSYSSREVENDSQVKNVSVENVSEVCFGWIPEKGHHDLTFSVFNGTQELNRTSVCVDVSDEISWNRSENITVYNALNLTLHDYAVLLKLDPSIFNYSEVKVPISPSSRSKGPSPYHTGLSYGTPPERAGYGFSFLRFSRESRL